MIIENRFIKTEGEGAENDVRCVRIASPLTSAAWRALAPS